MKIYTRGGDDGTTGLLGAGRARKDERRIEAIGAVDELNAALGWAALVAGEDLPEKLRRIQAELFAIGAHLAAPDTASAVRLPPLGTDLSTRLEHEIDDAEAELPPLRQFILPGGTESAARLHLCRAVCRRTERATVHLHDQSPVDAPILAYLNRLSDWLFVHARQANHRAGQADIPWTA